VLRSGQPQTDVTTPSDELHGKVSTDDSGTVVIEARGMVASGAAVRKLLGTAYSAGAEGNEAVVVELGTVDSGAVVEVAGYCWHSRERQRGGSGEPHSGTGLTVNTRHHIDQSTDLRFYVPPGTKQVISETFFTAKSLGLVLKSNLTQQQKVRMSAALCAASAYIK